MRTASPNKCLILFLITTFLSALLLGACGTVVPTMPAEGQVTPTAEGQEQEPAQQEPLQADACLPGILPGQSTREDVIAALGEPESVEVSDENGDETLTFPADDQAFPVLVVVRDGVVALVGKSVDEQTLNLTELLQTYGEPESTTFSNFMMHSRTYLYPSAGAAFVVAPDSDQVFYQQCTQPSTLAEYMSTWGSDLPLENPFTY